MGGRVTPKKLVNSEKSKLHPKDEGSSNQEKNHDSKRGSKWLVVSLLISMGLSAVLYSR